RTHCWPTRTCAGSISGTPSACRHLVQDAPDRQPRRSTPGRDMKARLQTSLGQHLVMPPQLRQAIRLLQMSSLELQAEVAEAIETNPLLEWTDDAEPEPATGERSETTASDGGDDDARAPAEAADEGDWSNDGPTWEGGGGFDDDQGDDAAERMREPETLSSHLLWQLHLSPLSARDRLIGATLIDALDEDGYLREPLAAIAQALLPDICASEDEILTVLHQLQRFDPVGVAARGLGECLRLQLDVLPADTPGRELALRIVDGPLERLPRSGIEGIAHELRCAPAEVEQAVQLVRSLDPRPGKALADLDHDNYVVPD